MINELLQKNNLYTAQEVVMKFVYDPELTEERLSEYENYVNISVEFAK